MTSSIEGASMSTTVLGFIGLGVMGSGMCANLMVKSGTEVIVFDPVAEALASAVDQGGLPATDVGDVAARSDIVFLSLPSIDQVESVCEELASGPRPPRIIVDMSTSDVTRTRALAEVLGERDVALVDAPVARMRQAAQDGTLLITVGATDAQFAELEPWLSCMGSDVIHAGAVGNGQVIKIVNNMVLFLNMNALAEAMTIGRAAGVDGALLFETLALGSADSFALRKTATATMIPDEFPEKAFPTNYAIKDLALALSLADDQQIAAHAARQTMSLLERTRDAGYGLSYYPAMIRIVDGRG
ncbi:NAD(P)-dependent oxidoreductase [Aeromicrobium sp. UC242_57]|uniref:NAD(P)-dependent oxidoreductase n=1 Tax=Aeromicrobium sp. UC242_57 TaxID=3374624 RepID=UPI00378F457E